MILMLSVQLVASKFIWPTLKSRSVRAGSASNGSLLTMMQTGSGKVVSEQVHVSYPSSETNYPFTGEQNSM